MKPASSRGVASFTVQATSACDGEAQRLWHDLHGPSCAGAGSEHCLVAHENGSNRILGIARYFPTFPPEEACGAVLVVPGGAAGRVGERLLRVMAEHARGKGIRSLGTLIGRHDTRTMELLRDSNMPIHLTRMNGLLYVEMDLVTFTASGVARRSNSR